MFQSVNQENGVGRWAVLIIAGLVAGLVILFMMMTTFTFGHDVIGGFILSNMIGTEASRLVSGFLCVLLFDAGWISALGTFVKTADSLIQRATAIITFVACFLFSLLASIFSVILLSPFSEVVDPNTLLVARYGGVGVVIIAFALNSASFAIHILTSPENAESIRLANRNAKAIGFNQKMANRLDRETFEKAQTLIEKEMPLIAQQRADNALDFYRTTYGYLGAGATAEVKSQTAVNLNGKESDPFLVG